MTESDDPFKAAEHREMLERRTRRIREWQDNAFADCREPSRRQVPQQSTADYLREIEARNKAEKTAQDEADLKAAKAAAEIDRHLPKPFTS